MDLTDINGNGPDVVCTFDSDADPCLWTRTEILGFIDIYEKAKLTFKVVTLQIVHCRISPLRAEITKKVSRQACHDGRMLWMSFLVCAPQFFPLLSHIAHHSITIVYC